MTSWFRDYLYYPLAIALGRNQVPPALSTWFNTMIVFLVCGLWHGASWTFVVFGGLHGFYIVFGLITRSLRGRLTEWFGLTRNPSLHRMLQVVCTFLLVSFTKIFFRAGTMSKAWLICRECLHRWGDLFHPSVLLSQLDPALLAWVPLSFAGVAVMLALESWRARPGTAASFNGRPWWFRWGFYYALTAVLFFLHTAEPAQFIYFHPTSEPTEVGRCEPAEPVWTKAAAAIIAP